MIRVDNIVESFVDSAFCEINPDVVFPKPVCHDCVLKDEIFNNQEKMINERDGVIAEKTATIKGLMNTIKDMTKERTDIMKKAKETESLKKDGQLAIEKEKSANAQSIGQNVGNDDITVEAEVKTKCKFTAPNIQLLTLHIENDHEV